MDHNDREQFWKTLCSLPGNDIVADREQLFKSIKYPKLLFRYRPVSTKSLEALRTNKLYFSSANYYDDPFDTFLHIDIEAIRKEYLSAFQTPESTEAVVDGVKSLLGNILSEEQAAQFTVENVTNALSHGLTESFLNAALSLRDEVKKDTWSVCFSENGFIVKRISAYELRTTNNGTQNSRVRMHKNKIYAPALHELIHYRKLPPQLLDYFGDRRYIHDYNTDGWMEIDSKIAQIYMRTLAEYSIKCSGKDIVLGTDTSTHSREIYNSSRNRADLQAQCCKINIENCLPQPSMDVSFEDILKFKNRRKDELNAFRAKIRELETNIYNAYSPELIRHYEAQFIEGWQQCSDDFYKVLKESRITFFLSSFVSLVAIPFVGQLLSPHIGQELTSAIQAGAPLLNIGIGYFDYRNKISPAKADGGFSYIIKANRDGIIHI